MKAEPLPAQLSIRLVPPSLGSDSTINSINTQQIQALRLVNEIQRKAPDFVASAQQAVKNARTRIAGMDQMAQANEKNSSALTKRVDGVIGKWGSGGG